jgi:hypothetical protein
MKTRLLEDIDENGSAAPAPVFTRVPTPVPAPAAEAAPAPPAVEVRPAPGRAGPLLERASDAARTQGVRSREPREPAVWHRPEASADPADATTPNPARSARKPPAPPESSGTTEPRFAPQPPGFHVGLHAELQHRPPGPNTVPQPSPAPAGAPPAAGASPFAAEGPDWLAVHLREDAALRNEPEWNSVWKRRMVTWSMAAVLFALAAAAGLWMVQETQVEGALVVVANTSPPVVPATPAPRAAAPPALSATGTTDAQPAAVAPESVAMAPETGGGRSAPRAGPAVAATPAEVPAATSTPREPEPERARAAPRHRKVAASAQPRPAAPASREPSARLRREETLMQCRAHGYDERQCIQRGCVMTRYGLACRG